MELHKTDPTKNIMRKQFAYQLTIRFDSKAAMKSANRTGQHLRVLFGLHCNSEWQS